VITVTVHGLPAAQGSKRHVGGGRMVEMSKALAPWREAVRAETQHTMNGQPPLEGPLRLAVTFYLPRPKGHTGARGLRPSAPVWPAVRPDLDKCARAAMDGMGAGGAYLDDAQIVELGAAKVYAGQHPTGMVAELRELS
jgi:crossover junction endodeoxyribonuclease RusA